MRKYQFLLAVVCAGVLTQTTQAGAILNTALSPGANTITDVSVDRFLDSRGVPITNPFHMISVGDQIEGIAKFTAVNTNSFGDLGLPAGYQLNAYFKLSISSFKSGTDANGPVMYATFSSGFGANSNVLAKLFETDNAIGHKVNFANSAATSVANVLAENHVLDVSLVGANDFFLLKNVTEGQTIANFVAGLLANGDNRHLFNFGLTITNNTGMVPFAPNQSSTTAGGLFPVLFFDITGNGQLTSRPNGANHDWQVGDLTTTNFAIIPEPASVISFSLGGSLLLLGLVHAWYRKRALVRN